jgi:hypothetical protein
MNFQKEKSRKELAFYTGNKLRDDMTQAHVPKEYNLIVIGERNGGQY